MDALASTDTDVLLARVEAAEVDEMWSFVGKKKAPRWLWHALDHRTGELLASVFGRREDQAFLELKALIVPFGITRFYTDGWGAYTRHLDPAHHAVGKRHTQRLIVEMTLNGSGIRDTARVLRVSPVTVLSVIKKRAGLNLGQ